MNETNPVFCLHLQQYSSLLILLLPALSMSVLAHATHPQGIWLTNDCDDDNINNNNKVFFLVFMCRIRISINHIELNQNIYWNGWSILNAIVHMLASNLDEMK